MLALCALIAGCSTPDASTSYPLDNEDTRREKRGKLTGDGGLSLFGGKTAAPAGSVIGVNSFLWRATLDTLSFMPLSSVDPHGGVIITDWYEDPKARGERFKLNVVIMGAELRADAVRVSVFRQTRTDNGWSDALVGKETARELEDKILTRSRELRIKAETH